MICNCSKEALLPTLLFFEERYGGTCSLSAVAEIFGLVMDPMMRDVVV